MVKSLRWIRTAYQGFNYFNNGRNARPLQSVYVLFDLLWDNGRDLTGKSVVHRRKRLQEIITAVDGIQVGGYVEERGKYLFQLAK